MYPSYAGNWLISVPCGLRAVMSPALLCGPRWLAYTDMKCSTVSYELGDKAVQKTGFNLKTSQNQFCFDSVLKFL